MECSIQGPQRTYIVRTQPTPLEVPSTSALTDLTATLLASLSFVDTGTAAALNLRPQVSAYRLINGVEPTLTLNPHKRDPTRWQSKQLSIGKYEHMAAEILGERFFGYTCHANIYFKLSRFGNFSKTTKMFGPLVVDFAQSVAIPDLPILVR